MVPKTIAQMPRVMAIGVHTAFPAVPVLVNDVFVNAVFVMTFSGVLDFAMSWSFSYEVSNSVVATDFRCADFGDRPLARTSDSWFLRLPSSGGDLVGEGTFDHGPAGREGVASGDIPRRYGTLGPHCGSFSPAGARKGDEASDGAPTSKGRAPGTLRAPASRPWRTLTGLPVDVGEAPGALLVPTRGFTERRRRLRCFSKARDCALGCGTATWDFKPFVTAWTAVGWFACCIAGDGISGGTNSLCSFSSRCS